MKAAQQRSTGGMAQRTLSLWFALALAGGALAVGSACDDEPARSAPGDRSAAGSRTLVSEAGFRTFGEQMLSLNLDVASPGADYEAAGLIEPGEGRFSIGLRGVSSPSENRPSRVIGLGGEGFENTVEETIGGFGQGRERCWFNPHAPVGSFLGTASVEESVRVIGAALESLGEEVSSARPTANRAYAVALDPSAARPRDDFRDRRKRVWGDRNLLGQLEGPIEIALSADGRVAEIALGLRDYEPYDAEFLRERGPIPRATIMATLRPTDKKLVIDPPPCQAIE